MESDMVAIRFLCYAAGAVLLALGCALYVFLLAVSTMSGWI
jgi:hypothetical protein